jgi:hypothetical protein
MSDTVPVTFRYALGQRVRWALEPEVRWRVMARLYEQSQLRSGVRYQLRAMDETQDAVAYEDDLASLEDT